MDAQLRDMPATHVAFLACVAVGEMERASTGQLGFGLQYLKAACRPEGATTGSYKQPVA